MDPQKRTSASAKNIGVPITSEEKYKKMLLKNPILCKFKKLFDLDIDL